MPVVTGLGATTPVGGDAASTWAAMLAGRSGVRALTEEWAEQLPVQIAARVAVEPAEVLARVAGPPAGPVRPVRDDRGPRGVGGRRLRGPAGGGRGPGPARGRLASGIGGVTTLLSTYDTLQGAGPGGSRR